jgi:hypothetical protein
MLEKGRALAALRNGVVMCGHHEPLIFRRRCGSARVNEAERFAHEHSEEVVKGLAARKVNWVRTHFYKGFGLAAEREELEITRRFIQLCHEHNIKVEIYTQFGTLQYETFLAEVPGMKDWATLDRHGEPYTIHYGHQDFRWIPCTARDGYWQYFQSVLQTGIDFGADGFGIDNVENPMLPDICYCPECEKGFIAFLKAKYRPDTPLGSKFATERFGFAVLDHVRLPRFNVWNPPIAHAHLRNPIFQEWIDFRCENLRRRFEEIWNFVKSRRPDMMLEYNVYPPFGENAAYFQGIDMHRLLPWMDCTWNERPPMPSHAKPDGSFYHKIHSFKLAEAFGSLAFTSHAEGAGAGGVLEIGLSEALAFNGGNMALLDYTSNFAAGSRRESDKYIQFRNQHPQLFELTRSAAKVGLIEHAPSLTFNCLEPHYSAVLAFNGLLGGHVPFDLVPEITPQRLRRYTTIVLPNAECLSDDEIKVLLEYVQSGGGLVLTDQTGVFDGWRRRRPQQALLNVLIDPADFAKFNTAKSREVKGVYGKGRFVYLPRIEPQRPFDAQKFAIDSIAFRNSSEHYPHAWDHAGFAITKEHWTLPKNQKQFVAAVEWVFGAALPVSVSGPESLAVETRLNSAGELIVHLLNYNLTKAAGGVSINCSESKYRHATLFTPGSESAKNLKISNTKSGSVVKVGAVERYAVVQMKE